MRWAAQFASFLWNVTLSSVTRMVYYAGICAAVPVLRRKQLRAAAFRVPGGLALPILGVAICALLLAHVDFGKSLILLATIAGVLLNWAVVRDRALRAARPERRKRAAPLELTKGATSRAHFRGTRGGVISRRMQGRHQTLWRRRLRRELAGLIALKLVALALLWWLFFSPAHRTAVDADGAGRRLGVPHAAASAEATPFASAAQSARHD